MVDITPEDQDFAAQALAKLNPSTTVAPVVNPNANPYNDPIIAGPAPIITDNNVPASIVAPPSAPVAPFNMTAPNHLNPGAPVLSPTPVANKPVGGPLQQAPAAPLVSGIPVYNPLTLSDDDIIHKDDKRAELNGKFEIKKAELNDRLADESDPKKIAALQVQLKQLDGEQGKALNTFDAANKQFSTDKNGNIIDDLTKLPSTLTKKQIADQESRYHEIGEGNETRAGDRLRTAQQSEIDATVAKNDAVGKFDIEQGQIALDNANKRAADRAISQQEIDKRQNVINQATDAHAKEQVDPNSVYKNTSTGSAIATTLLAALTGAFDGLNHINRPNSVVSAVDKIVANDIDAQKVNIDKHGKDIDRKQNSLNQFIQQGFSKDEAADMLASSLYKAASLKFQGQLAQYDNPIVQAKGAQIVAGLDQEAARRATAANAPYAHAQLVARAAPPAGAGANKGFITTMIDGKLFVKNVATGQISEANDEQKGKYYDTEGKRATTAKTEASIGAPPKQNGRITQILSKSSNLPELTANVKDSYNSGGFNAFGSTTKTDSNLNQWAAGVSAATGIPTDTIIHDVKNPWLNDSSSDIIDHYAKQAELKRSYYEKNPSAAPANGESEGDNAGNGE